MTRHAIDVSKLTPEEKLDLIDELWQSLLPEDVPLTPEQRAELDLRLDRLDRDGPKGVAWERLRSEMNPGKS